MHWKTFLGTWVSLIVMTLDDHTHKNKHTNTCLDKSRPSGNIAVID